MIFDEYGQPDEGKIVKALLVFLGVVVGVYLCMACVHKLDAVLIPALFRHSHPMDDRESSFPFS